MIEAACPSAGSGDAIRLQLYDYIYKMKLHLFVAVCSILLSTQGAADMEAGYRDRVLPSMDGEPMSLGQYRGSRILLMDFASW